jgi:dTDP-L-rhamnose 4-epimerase
MAKRILITGGAGFVGSHVADELLERGYAVRVLDNLSPQVHGENRERPDYLAEDVELLIGDVRDAAAVERALKGVDAVYHFAAAVGVGQSMYEISEYTSVNSLGTAVLLEQLVHHRVERLVVASSMSIYGEGLYRAADGRTVAGRERSLDQLKRHEWELRDADGSSLAPIPTPETKMPALPSVYAINKYDQERLCLTVARAYDIEAVGLRFFNIYGPRQALSNPYTGVLAIFASRYLNGQAPLINEDGHQCRDFVSVRDVARACRLALEQPGVGGEVFNIGSGEHFSVREVASAMARVLDCEHIQAEVTGRYRMGDIRHCFADISHAEAKLGYRPQVRFEEGLADLAAWLEGKTAEDRVLQASQELARRGLTV